MEMMELIDKLQEHYKDFSKRMRGRIYYDDQETKTLLEGYTEELASFFSKELSRARGDKLPIEDRAKKAGFELSKLTTK